MTIQMNNSGNYWDILPNEVRSKIFEYDGTYKEMMKEIKKDIWRANWLRYLDSMEDEYRITIFKYLFMGWGVYYDYLLLCESQPMTMHPDNVYTVLHRYKKGFNYARVIHNNQIILQCFLVDDDYEDNHDD